VVPAEVVVAVAEVRGVAVHHVAQKAVEEIESALVGRAGGFQAEMPLADDGRMVAHLLQFLGECPRLRIEPTPRILRVRTDDAGHAHAIGVTPGQERGARRRAHGGVRAHRRKQHPFRREAVNVRRAHVRGMIGGEIAVAVVIGQDQEEVGFGRRTAQKGQTGEPGGD